MTDEIKKPSRKRSTKETEPAGKATDTEKQTEHNIPAYDLQSVYQEYFKQQQNYFETQQKKVLEYWTAVLNSMWGSGPKK